MEIALQQGSMAIYQTVQQDLYKEVPALHWCTYSRFTYQEIV